jgi:hypothetical protein
MIDFHDVYKILPIEMYVQLSKGTSAKRKTDSHLTAAIFGSFRCRSPQSESKYKFIKIKLESVSKVLQKSTKQPVIKTIITAKKIVHGEGTIFLNYCCNI